MMAYDIETRRPPEEVEGGWDNPFGMGFGTAVVYDFNEDRYYFMTDAEAVIDRLIKADRVLSFNGIRFDNCVLLGNEGAAPWMNEDLLVEVICRKFGVVSIAEAVNIHGAQSVFDRSCNLDTLSRINLGRGKTGHGAKAPLLMRQNEWAKVWNYNLECVRLTVQLWRFKERYGHLHDGHGNRIPFRLGLWETIDKGAEDSK